MKIIQRAATLAAATFALVGFASASTPGHAADLTHPRVTPAILVQPLNNAAIPQSVPTPAPAPLPQTNDDSVTAAPQADEPEKFDSLAEAVAAQDQEITSDAVRCLATAVYFESKSEPIAGQLAVAQVIINRSKSHRFPPDVCAVVKQHGQFSFVHGGVLPELSTKLAQYRTALAIAKVALADEWDSQASNALFFHARRVSPGWKAIKVAAIGNHIFYR